MQRFSVFLLMSLVCANTWASVNLPVVDVSGGRVSARAAFGEEIAQQNNVVVEPVKKNTKRNVVARSAKKSVVNNSKIAQNDVLKPKRPSSDLWAKNESSLRMPRMDEINVLSSNDLLPEESLNAKPVLVAAKTEKSVEENQNLKAELDVLRAEVNRLTQKQKETEKIALTRPAVVRMPVSETVKEERGENKDNIHKKWKHPKSKQMTFVSD